MCGVKVKDGIPNKELTERLGIDVYAPGLFRFPVIEPLSQ